jgi:hypothetical protein
MVAFNYCPGTERTKTVKKYIYLVKEKIHRYKINLFLE